jgi:hypothetical protein
VIALLDVNVLVALFDPAQVHHEAAHAWFGRNRGRRWATCALTENALVRALSTPTYPSRRTTVEDAASRLRTFCSDGEHVFWPDDQRTRPRTVPLESRSGSSPTYRRLSSRAFDIEPWPAGHFRLHDLPKAVEGAVAQNLELLAA